MRPQLVDSAARYTRCAHESAGRVIRAYSTSFALACRVLPRGQRRDIASVYALVRVADEIVDGAAAGAGLDSSSARTQLDALEKDTLAAIDSGFSENLVVHAFADVARRTRITHELVMPFFNSMRTDLTAGSHDRDSFNDYVYGSAEVVGLMCLHVFVGARPTSRRQIEGARRLGAAFQKINFLRDLKADDEMLQRRYFPDIDPVDLQDSDKQRLVTDIYEDLAAARAVIATLPPRCRPAVQAAHDLFFRLTRQIENLRARQLRSGRVRVNNGIKTWLVVRAMVRWRLA